MFLLPSSLHLFSLLWISKATLISCSNHLGLYQSIWKSSFTFPLISERIFSKIYNLLFDMWKLKKIKVLYPIKKKQIFWRVIKTLVLIMWNWIRSWGNVNDRQIKQKSKIKTQQFVTQVWIWDENGKFFFYEKGLSRCYKIFKPQSAHTRADLLISCNRHCQRKGLPQVHGASKVLCLTCFTFQTSNVLLHTPTPNIPSHFPWTQETNVLDSFTMIDLRSTVSMTGPSG